MYSRSLVSPQLSIRLRAYFFGVGILNFPSRQGEPILFEDKSSLLSILSNNVNQLFHPTVIGGLTGLFEIDINILLPGENCQEKVNVNV